MRKHRLINLHNNIRKNQRNQTDIAHRLGTEYITWLMLQFNSIINIVPLLVSNILMFLAPWSPDRGPLEWSFAVLPSCFSDSVVASKTNIGFLIFLVNVFFCLIMNVPQITNWDFYKNIQTKIMGFIFFVLLFQFSFGKWCKCLIALVLSFW